MERNRKVDHLRVRIFDTRDEMGKAAALDIRSAIHQVLAEKEFCNMIFAAAPSQNEVLAALAASDGIEWRRVRAFHMDEYIGLHSDAPQSFANFLRAALFDRVPLKAQCIDGTAVPAKECRRYTALLREYPADIVVMGIGENGHIAFNDPHAARFQDPEQMKVVELDEVCRTQQVHDGCFASVEEVPKAALTLTIPALMAPKSVFSIVPSRTKAKAVQRVLKEPVSEQCPASVLRHHPNGVLYLDADSASLL